MGLCCLLHNKKQYAYETEILGDGYVTIRVAVHHCTKCGEVRIKRFSPLNQEYQYFVCDTFREIVGISKVNGIPLLGEVFDNIKEGRY